MNSVFILSAITLIGLSIHEPSFSQTKPIPVSVTCRKSFLQGSYVLQVQNTSRTPLDLWLQAKGKLMPFMLAPGKIEEFGWAQGYRFDANNRFEIGADSYDTLKQRMPNVELNPVKVDFSRDGGLSISLSQSYLGSLLPKYVKLPIRESVSSSLEFSLNELPQMILIDGSERIYCDAMLEASLLSGGLRFPLKASVSFLPSYSLSTGEVVAAQIQVENIDVNVPGTAIGLLPSDWREQARSTINVILPLVFDKLVLIRIEQKWVKNLLNALNLRARVIDGRLELIIL